MNTRQNAKSGSTIEQQINAVSMSQQQRNAVRHEARIAELFVDAIAWVCNKVEQPSTGVFVKPSPKY